jgi:hypothetical protein
MRYSDVTHVIARHIHHNPDNIALYPRDLYDDGPRWIDRFKFEATLADMADAYVSFPLHHAVLLSSCFSSISDTLQHRKTDHW